MWVGVSFPPPLRGSGLTPARPLGCREEAPTRIGCSCLHPPGVVPGGQRGETLGLGVGAEHAELHPAVAHHVGIGRLAALVAVEQVVHHEPAVVRHEVDDAKLDPESVADRAGVQDVLLPRAVAEDVVLVDPVLHVRADDRHARLLEQERGDGAVHAAGHRDEDFFRSRHGTKRREGAGVCQTNACGPAKRGWRHEAVHARVRAALRRAGQPGARLDPV
jgi:hypothetical protein